jgi:hypothetical protein
MENLGRRRVFRSGQQLGQHSAKFYHVGRGDAIAARPRQALSVVPMDIMKGLSELVRLNWKNAFSLLFGGVTVLILRSHQVLQDRQSSRLDILRRLDFGR